jgi:hypothetical protein
MVAVKWIVRDKKLCSVCLTDLILRKQKFVFAKMVISPVSSSPDIDNGLLANYDCKDTAPAQPDARSCSGAIRRTAFLNSRKMILFEAEPPP